MNEIEIHQPIEQMDVDKMAVALCKDKLHIKFDNIYSEGKHYCLDCGAEVYTSPSGSMWVKYCRECFTKIGKQN